MEREKLISIVRAVQNGEENAATELYDAFYDDIYYYIMKTVNDPELAADLTQDTFLEILQTIGSLQEPAAFVTWSRQVAYHRCTAHFKKRRELLADEDEDGNSVFDSIAEEREEFIPDEALDKEELKKTIQAMIDALPEEQRSAILMRYFEEISVKEIAEIQGVTEGTVKSRLNYGRKAIKQSVEDYEKKNNIKLHCAGVIPLLLWFFKGSKGGMAAAARTAVSSAAETASATASAAAPAASATASTAAPAASAAAPIAQAGIKVGIKAAGKAVIAKVIAGVAAVAVVAGGVAVGMTPAAQACVLEAGPSFREDIPEHVVKITFTDIEVPDGAETFDVSAKQDGSIVAWTQETDEYNDREYVTDAAYEMFVTTKDGSTIYANEDCSGMFSNGGWLTDIIFDNFDTSNVEDMSIMFSSCENLTLLDLSPFDVSRVSCFDGMFSGCAKLTTIYASNWTETSKADLGSGEDMFSGDAALVGAAAYNSSQMGLEMANNTNGYFSVKPTAADDGAAEDALAEDAAPEEDVPELEPSILEAGTWLRMHIPEHVVKITFTDIEVPDGVETFDVSAEQDGSIVAWTQETDAYNDREYVTDTAYEMFVTTVNGGTICANEDCSDMFAAEGGSSWLTEIIFDNFDTSNVLTLGGMFSYCRNLRELDLSNFHTSNVTDMRGMFYDCCELKTIDLSSFDTSSVYNMGMMFYGCESLESVDVSHFNTANVLAMDGMFGNCYSLQRLDLTSFITSNVLEMKGMFQGCYELRTLDLSSFDTGNVCSMEIMFYECRSLESISISHFSTSNVVNMKAMFSGCNSLKALDLHGWDTSNAEDMSLMFNGCESLEVLDISGFNVRSVICNDTTRGFDGMFSHCESLMTIYAANWTEMSAVESGAVQDMFTGDAALAGAVPYSDSKTGLEMANNIDGYFSVKPAA